MNYNYISCIDSKKKPDIYIAGNIALSAKTYRFANNVKNSENIIDNNTYIKNGTESDIYIKEEDSRICEEVKKILNINQISNDKKNRSFKNKEDKNIKNLKCPQNYIKDNVADGKALDNIYLLENEKIILAEEKAIKSDESKNYFKI